MEARGVLLQGSECGLAVWLDRKEERRGENLTISILREHDVLGLKASAIRSKIIGIRFFHFVSEKNDFAKVGAMWGNVGQWDGYGERISY